MSPRRRSALVAVCLVGGALGCGASTVPAKPVFLQSTPAAYDPISSGIAAADIPCQGGWCWTNFPRGGAIAAGWFGAHDDVWLVGAMGTTMHFDGTTWTAYWAGPRDLTGVWRDAEGRAWAITVDAAMLRWNGTAWSDTGRTAPCGFEIASAAGVAWCVVSGDPLHPNALARFDGSAWEVLDVPPALVGTLAGAGPLWAASRDDVFVAVGDEVVRYGAGGWTAFALDVVISLSGSAPDDVWATTRGSNLWHFDGSGWSQVKALGAAPLFEVFVARRGDVWVTEPAVNGGVHLIDGVWRFITGVPTWRIWADPSTGEAWGITSEPPRALAHSNGAGWTPFAFLWGGITVFDDQPDGTAMALVATQDTGVALARYDGQSWSEIPGSRIPGEVNVYSGGLDPPVYAPAPDDVWLQVDTSTCLHWNGTAWAQTSGACALPPSIPRPPAPPRKSIATWSPTPGTVFALGSVFTPVQGTPGELQDAIWRWNGEDWADELLGAELGVPSGTTYRLDDVGAMWGAAPDDGWAILQRTYRYHGESWTPFTGGLVPFHARCLWGTAADDVWASVPFLGSAGVVWHWDGSAWSEVATVARLECGAKRWAWADGGSLWRREGR